MKSFKENAEYLQSQAEAFNGISAADVRLITFEFLMDLSSILQQKGQHEARVCMFEAFEELKTQKSKDDEKSN